VAAPLFTADARDLRLLARPRWQRRLLAWTLPVAASVLLGLHVWAAGNPVCTPASPCQPDPLGNLAVGLLAGAAVSGFVYPRLATWFAGGFVVALIVSERLLHPDLLSPAWLYLVDIGFVGLCVLLAGVSRDQRPTDRALQWLVGVRRQRPPAVERVPRPGGIWRLAARMLAVAAVACVAWSWYAQDQADARQQAAGRATAEVIGHPDDFTIEVRLGEQTTRVDVLDAANYPVGGRIDLYVDDDGLRQPVSEPYDATGWLFLGVFLGAFAAAAGARGVHIGHGPRHLFEEEQPVTEVSVLVGLGVVAVYAGDARPGEAALVEIRAATLPTEHGIRPATLYGVPAPGHWCAVMVDGEVLPPTRVLSAGTVAAPPYGFDEVDLHTAARGPLRAEEVAALRPTDREAPPDQVRLHVRSPLVGCAVAASLPLALMLPSWLLPDFSYRTALLISAAVLGASCALSWRTVMRGRVAWNARGIAVIGSGGEGRVPWSDVVDIRPDRATVVIQTTERALVVGAGPVLGLFGRRDRGTEELANALRHARNTAGHDAADGLPRLEAPRAPAGLYLVWLLGTPVLAWLLQAYTSR
jgi:hypothetical protein